MRHSPLWTNHDFQILCAAQGLSAFGTQVSTIALPLLAARVTSSPAQAAVVVSVAGVAQIVTLLPGGVLADRLNRRLLAILCDAGSLAGTGLIAAAAAVGRASLPLLCVVSIVVCALGGVFHSTSGSFLRQVVSDAEMPRALAVNQARNAAAYLSGRW